MKTNKELTIKMLEEMIAKEEKEQKKFFGLFKSEDREGRIKRLKRDLEKVRNNEKNDWE